MIKHTCEGISKYNGERCQRKSASKYCVTHDPFFPKQAVYHKKQDETDIRRISITKLTFEDIRRLNPFQKQEVLKKYYSWINKERKKARILKHRKENKDNLMRYKLRKNSASN